MLLIKIFIIITKYRVLNLTYTKIVLKAVDNNRDLTYNNGIKSNERQF